MTKMAMLIYGKTFKNLLLQNPNPMIMKLDMQHWDLQLFHVYINYVPGLTLTSFINLVAFAFEWGIL